MPLSHDAKPRNRTRRLKGQHRNFGQSRRSYERRLLHARSVATQVFECYVRHVLNFAGKNWRSFERASKAETSRLVVLAQAVVNSHTQGAVTGDMKNYLLNWVLPVGDSMRLGVAR